MHPTNEPAVEAEIEIGNPAVFIGPNNSGKTSAMQAHRQDDIADAEKIPRRRRNET